jgi:hypothetical protein
MANPNKTVLRARQRVWSCVAEQIFEFEWQAKEWLQTQTGDRKTVRSFRWGPRTERLVKYVARVYVR